MNKDEVYDQYKKMPRKPRGKHKPVWLTERQAYALYEFLDDFGHEFWHYSQQGTVIQNALKRIIPNRFFEEED